jgi:molecular chaperone GrpE (heat shock protein)
MQDKYMRALAEAENVRRRSAIEIENQKQFAITKFAQSLLEVCQTKW